MKIAFFHELHAGGARRAANEFANYLRKNNTVDLFIIDENQEARENIFYDKVYYYLFTPKKWRGNNWPLRLYKDTLELFHLNSLHKKVAKKIDREKYDVVLVFPSKLTQAPFILKFLKTKTFYYAMEPLRIVYDPENKIPDGLNISRYLYERCNRLVRKVIDKSNINSADRIIAPSKFSAEFSSRVYKKIVDVAYLAMDASFFTASDKAKREVDLLFIGSKDRFDGYDFFKEVMKKVKSKVNAREVLFEKEWLTSLQIRDLYRTTKILVATSYNELLGMIPLEAMGCGVVVLAVDEAGYRESIIDKKNGFLIKRDAKAFAEKIDYLLMHETLLKKMSQFARHNVSQLWDWENRGNELENLLKKY